MKKTHLLIFAFVLFYACDKDEELNQDDTNTVISYEELLVGEWQLTAVKYDGEVSTPIGNIDVSGDGTDVSGGHTIGYDPNTIDYDYSFTAERNLMGNSVPIPVDEEGEGKWVLNEAEDEFTITFSDGSVAIWEVVTNEENRQVYEGELGFEYQGATFPVDVEFTFER